ncbi:MAG: DUF4296 domain-containing protein [Chitinophagaceae bacterium]
MRRFSFLLLITALLASCGSSKVPADIIPVHKMETILWQLMQSDEYVNTLLVKDSTKKSSTERMKIYQQVFDFNKTSMGEFKKSYHFYMTHPDITKVIFDSITARASRERIELYKPKPDSAKQAPPAVKGDTVARKPTINPQTGKFMLKPDTAQALPVKAVPAKVKKRSFKKKPVMNKGRNN